MVNLRKDDYGPAATKAVNLVAIEYLNSVERYPGSNVPSGGSPVYLDNRLHPDDRRAPGQTSLALKRPGRSHNNQHRFKHKFAPQDAAAIREAAGSNQAPVLNKKGEQIGIAYGFQADVRFVKDGVVPVRGSERPSGMSVQPNEAGQTIQNRIFEKQFENKAAKQQRQAPGRASSGPRQPQTFQAEQQMGGY